MYENYYKNAIGNVIGICITNNDTFLHETKCEPQLVLQQTQYCNFVTSAELMKTKAATMVCADIIEPMLSGALFKMKPSHLADVVSIMHSRHLRLHT